MQPREPIFNVPGAVVAIIGVMIFVHVLRGLLDPEQESWLVLALAFIPARYSGMAELLPGGSVASFSSVVTHMFVHGDVVHLGFNSAWLLAFGGAIALRVGGLRFLAFALVTGVAGVLTFLAVNVGLLAPVVGASGAVAGCMGGTMRFLFNALDSGGLAELRERPRSIPLMSLPEALADRRVLLTTAVWLVLNGLAILGFGGAPAGAVAWEAHVGGYFAGFLLIGLFDAPRHHVATHQGSVH